ncbi:hypothetical protein ACRCD4_05560 [Campylobacter taeniopygiae]
MAISFFSLNFKGSFINTKCLFLSRLSKILLELSFMGLDLQIVGFEKV